MVTQIKILVERLVALMQKLLSNDQDLSSSWLSSPQRSVEINYFTGNTGGLNPSSSTTNIETMVYKKAGITYRTVYYKWNAADQLIEQRNYPFS